MKVAFISVDYPDAQRNVFPFVKALVESFADRGNECAVIAPYSVTRNKRFHKIVSQEKTPNDARVTVIRPPYISLSKLRIGNVRFSERFHSWAVNRGVKRLPFKPDAVYGHFWQSALEGYNYCKRTGTPLFVATGESNIAEMFSCSPSLKTFYDLISGVICVSSKNKDESISLGLTKPEKCVVVPNAVDTSVFKTMDKRECREALNIQENSFVVAFVGWFNNRKGVLRVSDAIKKLEDKTVKSIFIGDGEQQPDCDGILFKGPVAHNDIPVYLNAADIFVLPTLQEGCCNSIVEAISCGLPIVSSDKAFNWDILNDTNSIMVNPNNVDEIALAINKLKSDGELRQELAEGALKTAEALSIAKRAERIELFIKEKSFGHA